MPFLQFDFWGPTVNSQHWLGMAVSPSPYRAPFQETMSGAGSALTTQYNE